MKRVSTESRASDQGDGGEPRLVGVVLVPEPINFLRGVGVRSQGLEESLNKLQLAFARRFTGGYFVSIRDGLVPVRDDYQAADKSWADLTFDSRHVYIDVLRKQLAEELADGRPCLCLLGSLMAQALRRTGIQYTMPLASMSRYQRRQWLDKATVMSNAALCNLLWGFPVRSDSKEGHELFMKA